jgi:hypothetical protein
MPRTQFATNEVSRMVLVEKESLNTLLFCLPPGVDALVYVSG